VGKLGLLNSGFIKYLLNLLCSLGYDEECVLKSVCELAKIPFHDEEEDSLLHEVLHLVLT
jgi:hypothetical protein